jgi:hypothetical protein
MQTERESILEKRGKFLMCEDWRICSKCGAEYDACQGGHSCDPADLAEIAQAEADSQEVENSGNGVELATDE